MLVTKSPSEQWSAACCTWIRSSTILALKDGTIMQVRKPSVPDSEQSLIFQQMGIDWKKVCPAQKFIMK
ncbi:MAG: hypothetical protein ACI9A1_000327 [Lentimonas sp.]|jgi:hypothetical protein